MKTNKANWLKLVLIAGVAFASATASAGDREDAFGVCRFRGVFDGGKDGGGFEVNCKAKFRFDARDVCEDEVDSMIAGSMNRNELEVECDDREVYEGDLKIKVVDGHGRGKDVVFKGEGKNAPKIFVGGLKFHDDRGKSKSAYINFSRWGYNYRLPGQCWFKLDRDIQE